MNVWRCSHLIKLQVAGKLVDTIYIYIYIYFINKLPGKRVRQLWVQPIGGSIDTQLCKLREPFIFIYMHDICMYQVPGTCFVYLLRVRTSNTHYRSSTAMSRYIRHFCIEKQRTCDPYISKQTCTRRTRQHFNPLGLQPRLGDKLLKIWLVCPQNGTAVLKGLKKIWDFLVYFFPFPSSTISAVYFLAWFFMPHIMIFTFSFLSPSSHYFGGPQ